MPTMKPILLPPLIVLILYTRGWISHGALAVVGAFCVFSALFLLTLVCTHRRAMRRGSNSCGLFLVGRYRCMKLYSCALSKFGTVQHAARMERSALARYSYIANHPVAKSSTIKRKVCLYGSDDFTYWKNCGKHLHPMQVYNSAFGGSTTLDLLLHLTDLVTRWNPHLIVYSCGVNDILQGASPEEAVAGFRSFVARVKETHPHMKFVYVCPMNSPLHTFRRTSKYVTATCEIAMAYCKEETNVWHVNPNEYEFVASFKNYINDGLHLTVKGHEKLGQVMLPVMKEAVELLK